LNSPFAIFVLSSVVVAGITRYWDRRQSQRYEARDRIKYLLETINRLKFVIVSLHVQPRLAIFEVWNVNNALDAGDENTYYHPLFLEFKNQPMSALLIFLEMTDTGNSELYTRTQRITGALREITEGLQLVEDETQKAEAEGLAQIWTYFELPPERVQKLEGLRASISQELEELQQVERGAERRL